MRHLRFVKLSVCVIFVSAIIFQPFQKTVADSGCADFWGRSVASIHVIEGKIAAYGSGALQPRDRSARLKIIPDLGRAIILPGSGEICWRYETQDGDLNARITIQVIRNSGKLAAALPFNLIVDNAPPTGEFAASPSIVARGQTVTLSFTNANDPGSADRDAGYTYSFDCNTADTITDVNSGSASSYTCSYPPNTAGDVTVGGRIIDKDRGSTSYTAQVSIRDVMPTDTPTPTPTPPINHPPVAVDDHFNVAAGSTLTVSFDEITSNDSDPDGDPLTVVGYVATGVVHGRTLQSASGVTYIPDPGFTGTDTGVYTISDGRGGTATANVSVTVGGEDGGGDTPPNRAPIAQDDVLTIRVNQSIVFRLSDLLSNDSDPDNDPLSIVSAVPDNPNLGTFTDNGDGSYTFTPPLDYRGQVTGHYTISDGHDHTSSATVTINIVED